MLISLRKLCFASPGALANTGMEGGGGGREEREGGREGGRRGIRGVGGGEGRKKDRLVSVGANQCQYTYQTLNSFRET